MSDQSPDYVRSESGDLIGYVSEDGSFAEHAFGHGAPAPYRKHDRTWSDDQQLSYVFFIDMLRKVNPRGVSSTSRPTPLTREEIKPVMLAIAAHEVYQEHTLLMHTKDFEPVVYRPVEGFMARLTEDDLVFTNGVPMPRDLARHVTEAPPNRNYPYEPEFPRR